MSAAITAAVVGVAGAAAMSNQQEIAGRHALADQEALQQEGISQEMEMFNLAREDRAPWVEAGVGGLEGYQNLMTPEGQTKAYTDYFASPMYAAQQDQASKDMMRSQSAHGGLRGGSTYSQLENIAPTLGANYISNLQNQNLNLANMGMGMAGQNAAGYQQLGTNQLNMYNQMGANQAAQQIAAANNQANMINSGIGMLGQAGMSYFGGKV